MIVDEDQISALLRQPSEGLQVEVKTWLDPRTAADQAKMIKAIFALRNRNGGFLVIGFSDETMKPDPWPFDEEVDAAYHPDVIQALVSKYASAPFEIGVAISDRAGQPHPIIVIPEGVQVPVVVKRPLIGGGGQKLVAEGVVYFRTLAANGIASSAPIGPNDYAALLDICFENREGDIGRFLRRHLPDVTAQAMESAIAGVTAGPSDTERAMQVIEDGRQKFDEAAEARGVSRTPPGNGDPLTLRVGLVLDPVRADALPTAEFLNRVGSGNPQYTGWPVWLDSRNFAEKEDRPYVLNGAWQALIVVLDLGWSNHFEFMRLDPKGRFFLQRVMQDDISEKVEAGTVLDPILMLYRVTEVLAVGLSIARALEWAQGATASFAFQWTGLKNRSLRSWANAFRTAASGQASRDASASSFVQIPVAIPHLSLGPYVANAVGPLFAAFGGYAASDELVEDSVRRVIERKMNRN